MDPPPATAARRLRQPPSASTWAVFPPGHQPLQESGWPQVSRLFTFATQTFFKTVDGVAKHARGSLLGLDGPPADWLELAATSSHSRFQGAHSGLDPQRPWDNDNEDDFFDKVAQNDVTRRRIRTNAPATDGATDASDKAAGRSPSWTAVANGWRSMVAHVRLQQPHDVAAWTGTLPLSPGYLSQLGERLLLRPLQDLFASSNAAVDFLLVAPPKKGKPGKPATLDPNWALPSVVSDYVDNDTEADRQHSIRRTWVPVLNALLREAMAARRSSGQLGGDEGRTDELVWVRESEVKAVLPDQANDEILLYSKRSRSTSSSADSAASGTSLSETGPIGLADFYLLYRRSTDDAPRVAAILECKPNVELGLLAHALCCTLPNAVQREARPTCHPHKVKGMVGFDTKAHHLVYQLTAQLAASAAPLALVLTGFQIIAIEREESEGRLAEPLDRPAPGSAAMGPETQNKLRLVVHKVAYTMPLTDGVKHDERALRAADGRCPNAAPPPSSASTASSSFDVDSREHLIARLLCLSLRAAERCDSELQQDPACRFRPFWPDSLVCEGKVKKGPSAGVQTDASGDDAGGNGSRRAGEDADDDDAAAGDPGERRARARPRTVHGDAPTSSVDDDDEDGGRGDRDAVGPQPDQHAWRVPGLRLCFRLHPFAHGADATVHLGCLWPCSEPLPCHAVSSPRGCDGHGSRSSHMPVAAKRAHGPLDFFGFLDDQDFDVDDDGLDTEGWYRRGAALEREASVYRKLEVMQGSVLPRYFGRYVDGDTECGPGDTWVYEHTGYSLDDRSLIAKLEINAAEAEELCTKIVELVHRLHAEGRYAHCDVALRNFCARRERAEARAHVNDTAASAAAATMATPSATLQTPQTPPRSPLAIDPRTPTSSVCGSGGSGQSRRHAAAASTPASSTLDLPTGSPPTDQQRPRGRIQVRLIDLGRAVSLDAVSSAEAGRLVEQDVARARSCAQRLMERYRRHQGRHLSL